MPDEISELDLSKKLGLSRETIAGKRKEHLTKGDDWRKSGRWIVFTQQGAEKLAELVGLVHIPNEGKKSLTEQSESVNEEEILTVVQHRLANTKILTAKRSNGEIVRVRVNSTKNFLPEMTFPAVCENGSGVWLCTRKTPRWLGKW